MTATASDSASNPPVESQPELKRAISPKLLLMLIVGDILGTGIYALTGDVAKQVGGAAWAPFLLAFVVATITGFSYLELVTKYPKAAGAALYTHKAFAIHFVTFIVAFAVMCSGITSASTASNAFAQFMRDGFNLDFANGSATLMIIALAFMAVVAAINLRGIGESVKTNLVLTCIELSGLLMVIIIGMWALGHGDGDFSRVVVFETSSDKSVFFAITAATSLAFFAMIGFEDSVNLAEETQNPSRNFPRVMLTGLGIAGVIYVLVSITAVALVPVGDMTDPEKGSALTQVVAAGAPNLPFDTIFPIIGMFAVANTALINMLMASRLLYGMANQRVLPKVLGTVHPTRRTPWVSILFTTLLAFGLITYVVHANASVEGSNNIKLLGGTTALLLLCVFTVVNIALLVLRRDTVDHHHFRTPTVLPIIGALSCAFLAGPWARDASQQEQYKIAAIMFAVGLVLWAIAWLARRGEKADADWKLAEPD